jgi:amidase
MDCGFRFQDRPQGVQMKSNQEDKVRRAIEILDSARLSRRDLLALFGYGMVASLLPACSPSSAPPVGDHQNRGPLHYLSLSEVARLIEAREISPVELTQMMLDRIHTLDARLHSYATVMADEALAAARAAEREIQSGNYRGPLHGIPIAVKDLLYTKGVPTMGGLKVLADFVPEFDATVISRLNAAGAVLLGKLTTTEGAMVGYHRDFDIPVNPWGEDYWAGVSSSGPGVATAAGLCFASLGTDTGGSIRFPATANGIVGLKPTYGRVSRHGLLPLAETLDHVGPMTRSVRDAAVVFEAIAGHDPNDSTSLQAPVPNMLAELGRGVEGLRIGFDRAYALDGVDPGLAAAIELAVAELQRLGAQIVDVQLPDVSEVHAAWFTVCAAEAAEAHRESFPSRAAEYGAYFRDFLEFGSSVSEADLAQSRQVGRAIGEGFLTVLSTVDAVLSPSGGMPFKIPPGLQYGSMTEWDQVFTEILETMGIEKAVTSFTFPHNFAGAPTLTLPCGVTSDGMPYAMQLAGSPLSEAMLCRIGQAYEEATPWHGRHPRV